MIQEIMSVQPMTGPVGKFFTFIPTYYTGHKHKWVRLPKDYVNPDGFIGIRVYDENMVRWLNLQPETMQITYYDETMKVTVNDSIFYVNEELLVLIKLKWS